MSRSVRSIFRFVWVVSLLSGGNGAAVAVGHAFGAPEGDVQHVLILNSHSVGVPWATIVHDAILDTFSAAAAPNIRPHVEFTGLIENNSADYAESLLEFYRQKYRDTPLSLIMTLDIAIIGGADAVGRAFSDMLVRVVADHGRSQQIINLIGFLSAKG